MFWLWVAVRLLLIDSVPLGTCRVTLNVLLLDDLPVQYKPAYTMLEQLGIAPFSVDNAKVADEELKVFGSPSVST